MDFSPFVHCRDKCIKITKSNLNVIQDVKHLDGQGVNCEQIYEHYVLVGVVLFRMGDLPLLKIVLEKKCQREISLWLSSV